MSGVSRETSPVRFAPTPEQVAQAEEIFGAGADQALEYCSHLSSTGVDHGLVGPREVPRMWERHVLNCAVVTEAIPESASVVDVGSGAGLPGIALAIRRPDLTVSLIEPLERRTIWLKNTIDALGLSVTVHRGRAEEFHGTVYADVVTARAVAGLGKLVPWLAPLVRADGQILALKGKSAADEISAATKVLRKFKVTEPEIIHCGVGTLDPPTTVVRAKLR